ncbi:MAG: thioesterase [Deltaproteobacteria bacterium]|nr:MAG: thioesterase [Deltaproteobacteria bacterium]
MKIPPEAWKGTFAHQLGMTFDQVEPGRTKASLQVMPHHCNPNRVCHGGAIFTLADDSMGGAVHPLCPEGTVPAATQVNIHYARSARAGDRLEVDTRVVSHGRRTALLESRVTDAKQRLVALLTASYLFVEPR